MVEKKEKIIEKLGEKKYIIKLVKDIKSIPSCLKEYKLNIIKNKRYLSYLTNKTTNISKLLNDLNQCNINYSDIEIKKSSLEDIFVKLIKEK